MLRPGNPIALGRPQAAAPVLLGASLFLTACERTEASTEIHVDALAPLVAVEEARLGDFDDPDTGFSRVGDVDLDRDGNVYVLEASVPEIRVYGPDGGFLRRIGRRGGGPGEFEGWPRFGVEGDTVWALDSGVGRITLFDREGTVQATGRTEGVTVPLPGTTWGYVVPWQMRPDGRFTSHFARVAFRRDEPGTGVSPTDSIPVPFVLFDPSGAVADTVGWAPRPPPRLWRPPSQDDTDFEFLEVGGRRRSVPSPPSGLPRWLPLVDGYLLVETPLATTAGDAAFTVTRMGLAGDTVLHREIRYRPTPYSAAALDTIARRAARGEPGGMVPFSPMGGAVPEDWERIARALREAMAFPEFQMPIQSVRVGSDGAIWLRQPDDGGESARWILLDGGGAPVGLLELPADVQVRWSEGDVFWALVPDDFGVPWLVRYRIRAAEEA